MIPTVTRMLVTALLCAEFLLSGIGYCGHTHTHVHPGAGCGIGVMQTEDYRCGSPHSHEEDADARNRHGDDGHAHRSHCFCLGQVEADITGIDCSLEVTYSFLRPLPSCHYDFLFKRAIFHPPILV